MNDNWTEEDTRELSKLSEEVLLRMVMRNADVASIAARTLDRAVAAYRMKREAARG